MGVFFGINDGNDTKIRFTKVSTSPNRRTQASQGMETIRDRWGIDSHSDVHVYTNKSFGDDNLAESWVLNIINDFIKRYRYFDREAVHLVPLSREDLFGLQVYSGGSGMFSVALAGGIATANPLLVHQISENIEKSLKAENEIPFWEELILNAEQYLYQSDFRHALLESVIALEVVISDFVKSKCKEKGISEGEAKNYIKNVGLDGSIKITLRLVLPEDLMPQERAIEKCKVGITLRNKVVHEGKKDITYNEANDALIETKNMISFLVPLL